ncbi:MAG TPA: ABC transporter permease [Patescibacteria group bacterium]|nr:ABC transporter permease [Patescibacteria group bacterium]
MIAEIKAEFRKLYTIRSTYVIVGLSLALVIFLTFYIEGIKNAIPSSHDPHRLASEIIGAVQTVSFILTMVGLLLVTHEYRYNTIMYTLTASNSRTKTLLAKFLVISVFVLTFSALFATIAPILTYSGLHFVKGLGLVHQDVAWSSIVWRSLFYSWGYGMIGLLLSVLLRNQVAAIAALFLIPSTIEPLLGMILKHDIVYLPFSSINAVTTKGAISYAHAAMVFGLYLVVGWVVAWVLFLRRDATN